MNDGIESQLKFPSVESMEVTVQRLGTVGEARYQIIVLASASPPKGLLPSGGRVGRPALLRSAPEIFSAIADALQGGLQSAGRFSSSLRRTGVPLATE